MSISFGNIVNTPGSATLTTKGDILTHDGTSPVRLAVGSEGQVLTSQSTATYGLSWRAAPASSISKWDLIHNAVTTANGAATYTISNIPSTYHCLRFIVQGKSTSTAIATTEAFIRINGDSTSSNHIIGYGYDASQSEIDSSATYSLGINLDFAIAGSKTNYTSYLGLAEGYIYLANDTSGYKTLQWRSIGNESEEATMVMKEYWSVGIYR